MSKYEFDGLEILLERLRVIESEMQRLHGGVAVLHLEAAVAALESHLRRSMPLRPTLAREVLPGRLAAD